MNETFVPELHKIILEINEQHKQEMDRRINQLNDICKKYGLEPTKLTWKSDHSEFIKECERIFK